ncbi:hypothetical protein [Brevibacillus daliensis]|uniref:hypothetical protein n=1 Tax=Brevibacillus daliensis TaxID=2892995 RepID=UPI001E5F1733|nr:hypothetical protein [Brevibacillus daliensis]
MNKRTYKIALTSLTVLLLFAFTACSKPQSEAPTKTGSQTSTENLGTEQFDDGHGNEADVETYASKESGFTLKYPEIWNDVIKVNEHKDDSMPAVEMITSFLYAPEGKQQDDLESLLNIYKVTQDNYAKMSKEEGPELGVKLAENDKFVWLGSLPQSNPFDPNSEMGKQFENLVVELEFHKKNLSLQ